MMKGSGSGRPKNLRFTILADTGTLHKSKYSSPCTGSTVLKNSVGASVKIVYTSVTDPNPAFHFEADPDPS